MDMNFRLDGDSIHNPTFLYSAQDDLLGPSLLTPESEPKFDLSSQKADTFGDYHSIDIGIYDPYDESRPSSIQFGDGLDPSEHEGSHVSTNGNGIASASGSNDIPARTEVGQHARTNGDLYSSSSAKVRNSIKGPKKNHRQSIQEPMSSAHPLSSNTPKLAKRSVTIRNFVYCTN
jgi:hypothetical protein